MADRRKNMEFGILAALVLLVAGRFRDLQLSAVIIIVLLITLLFPKLFTPFTWLWFRLGEILNVVVTKILLLLIFCIVITPVGLLRRILGKDALCLRKFKKDTGSVFVVRNKLYEASDLEKQY